jgi:hypothetical protein
MQALELLTSHPVARTRMTSLRLTQVLPAEAAVRLRNLRQLRMDTYVSVSEVQALQCLFCLTSLTVMGLRAKKEDLVLQPADLPSRLQVLRMKILDLYWFQHWLPALAAVSSAAIRYVAVYTCLLQNTSQLWHPGLLNLCHGKHMQQRVFNVL